MSGQIVGGPLLKTGLLFDEARKACVIFTTYWYYLTCDRRIGCKGLLVIYKSVSANIVSIDRRLSFDPECGDISTLT